jgi:myo-inositol-1(or 4)-monophosphatase
VAEVAALLELAKSAAASAGSRLLDAFAPIDRSYVHSSELPREVKAAADSVLERDILQALAGANLAILSEESGYIPAPGPSSRWFIVDPLDGTFNFIKGLGPSAVSIALWDAQTPIFGVIYDLTERQLAWGGAAMGAFVDGRRVSVSSTSVPGQASICTGFPVRFDVENDRALRDFCRLVGPYAKVRMLGSAAMALLQVARGSADVYLEQSIMLWDVAAGVAMVEGAGGEVVVAKTGRDWCYDVIASNPALLPHVPRPDPTRT